MSFSWTKASLHAKVIWAFSLLGFLFALEASLIVYFWVRIDQHAYQLELAQETRLIAQQATMDLQRFLNGRKDLLPQITTTARDASEILTALAKGGEWNGVAVSEPGKIQSLSIQKATEAWTEYHESLTLLTTNEIWKDSTMKVNDNQAVDSLEVEPKVMKVMNLQVARARALSDGQWMRVSELLKEFETDSRSALYQQRGYLNLIIGGVVLIDLLVLGLFYWFFRKNFLGRLHQLKESLSHRTTWAHAGHDEISQLGKELNTLTTQIDQASDFVVRIGEGKLDEQLGNEEGQGKLAQALEGMRVKLKSINEEDQKRRWANEGLTQFVDILRSGNDNIHVLGDQVISTMVKYTKSNQGGLYLVEGEGDHKYLELISLFAFNAKKFEKQRLKLGEGLVGQCFLETETIFLTEIPDDYIRITSGLGGSNPKSILIVPLKIDKEIYGIVELASFQIYEPHEISFVEKLGETIASTLSSVKNNQKTRRLLEDFQQQTEQMRAQEEEMRQNMEELTATQEEMTRKEQDYILKINQLENQKGQAIPGDDWAVATEMEKSLRIQLDALAIAQQELSEKA